MTRRPVPIVGTVLVVLILAACWGATVLILQAQYEPPTRVVHVTPSPTSSPTPAPTHRTRHHRHKHREHAASRSAPRVTPAPVPAAPSGGNVLDITAYCPTGNRNAAGLWPQSGDVATLDRSVPFGARLHIEGIGWFVVHDRIGYGSDVDIYMPSCADAVQFGRQHRRVVIEP